MLPKIVVKLSLILLKVIVKSTNALFYKIHRTAYTSRTSLSPLSSPMDIGFHSLPSAHHMPFLSPRFGQFRPMIGMPHEHHLPAGLSAFRK